MLRPAEAAATGQTPLPLRRPASEKSLCRNTVHVLQGDKVRVLASQEPVAWCRPCAQCQPLMAEATVVLVSIKSVARDTCAISHITVHTRPQRNALSPGAPLGPDQRHPFVENFHRWCVGSDRRE